MKKQTAVQWLESEIEKQIFQCETEWQCGYQKALNEVVFLLRQTKEMEKQQIGYSEEEMLGFAWFLVENIGQYSCDEIAHFEGKYLEQFKNK